MLSVYWVDAVMPRDHARSCIQYNGGKLNLNIVLGSNIHMQRLCWS